MFIVSVMVFVGMVVGMYLVMVMIIGVGGLMVIVIFNVMVSVGGIFFFSLIGSDLIISEYVEGISNNKVLEFYNLIVNIFDLSVYMVELYVNGVMKVINI